MTPDVLLVGCGDLGSAVGLRLAERGLDVLALRRNADRVPPQLRGLSVDLTRESPDLQDARPRLLVVALTARPRSEEAYRATYVEGMARALDALAGDGRLPERAVLVSSTAVHGASDGPPLQDESTPPSPADGPGRMLVAAEELFAERLPAGTVLRLSGLYGGASTRLLDRVREGRIDDPHRWTNRIHRDDAAAAVVHLLTRPEPPDRLYLGTDDAPAQLGDVAGFLAARLGAPTPPAADPARGHGKRLSNARLRSTGWEPSRPSYREGYADVRPTAH
ncbi:NAD-dependent epimerase/dehydratase family protein [Nocardioides sp.]|uniref:NAD-dependent epimerase/dehydratase family protein n=1 Tax=Nocardioides sp. TaxID=35761 RepID=UPI002B5DDFDF|nr:NAD-dependent epimerase/dehydratase family protein [Nocardioides sp.]HXH77408.1 NAD-dependent epimerase/dehydratase family protein [Nocardioides sp.]